MLDFMLKLLESLLLLFHKDMTLYCVINIWTLCQDWFGLILTWVLEEGELILILIKFKSFNKSRVQFVGRIIEYEKFSKILCSGQIDIGEFPIWNCLLPYLN